MTQALQNVGLPDALSDPLAFCEMLRDRHGFDLGVMEFDRVTRVLALAQVQNLPRDSVKDMHQLLSPVLSKSADEQHILRRELQLAFAPEVRRRIEKNEISRRRANITRERENTPESTHRAPPKRDTKGGLTKGNVIAAALALIFAVALGVIVWPPAPSPIPDPAGGTTGGGIVDTPSQLNLQWLIDFFADGQSLFYAIAILVVAVGAVVFYLYFRRLWASRDQAPADVERISLNLGDEDNSLFFVSAAARDAIGQLTHHIRIKTRHLDIPATLLATMKAGNEPKEVYRTRKRQPEFLVLFDRHDVNDLVQIACADFIAALQKQSVIADRFDYSLDPGQAVSVDAKGQNAARVSILDLLAKSEGRTVILFADPNRLSVPEAPHMPQPWLAELASIAGDLCVVSSVPLARLEDANVMMMRRLGGRLTGIYQLSAGKITEQGATSGSAYAAQTDMPLDQRLTGTDAPSEAALARLRRWMGLNLTLRARESLAALSLYPEITPALTRNLSRLLKDTDGNPVMTDRSLAEIAGLGWMREAYMPNWARRLTQNLIPEDRRFALARQVQNALEAKGISDAHLSVAIDPKPRLFGPFGWSKGGMMQDAVVARSGRRDPLAFLLPRRLSTGAAPSFSELGAVLLGMLVTLVTQDVTYFSFEESPLTVFPFLLLPALPHLVSQRLAAENNQVRHVMWGCAGVGLGTAVSMLGTFTTRDFNDLSLGFTTGSLALAFALVGHQRPVRKPPNLLWQTTWAGNLAFLVCLIALTASLASILSVADGELFLLLVFYAPAVFFASVICTRLRLGVGHIALFPCLAGSAFMSGGFLAMTLGSEGLGSPSARFLASNIFMFPIEANSMWIYLSGWGVVFIMSISFLDRCGVLPWGGDKGLRPLTPFVVGSALTVALLLPYTVLALISNGLYSGISAMLIALPLVLPSVLVLFIQRPDGRPWPRSVFGLSVVVYAAHLLVAVTVISAGLNPIYMDTLGLLALLSALVLCRIQFRSAIGTPVWTVFDDYEWSDQGISLLRTIALSVLFFAVLGFDYKIDAFSIDLGILVYPAALWLGATYGAAGFRAIAIGGVPLLVFGFFSTGPLSLTTNASIPTYFGCLLLARFGGMEGFRHDVFRAVRLTQWQTVFLTLGFVFSGSVLFYLQFAVLGVSVGVFSYLVVIFFFLGMSHVQLGSFLRPLIIVWALSFVLSPIYGGFFEANVGFDLTIRPSLSLLMSVPGLCIIFWVGQKMRALLVDPNDIFIPLGKTAVALVCVVLIGIPYLNLTSDTGVSLQIPYLAVFLFAAIGYAHGYRGIWVCLLLEVMLYMVVPILPFVLGFENISVNPIFGVTMPTSSVGITYAIGDVTFSLGNSIFAFLAALLRFHFCQRSGKETPKGFGFNLFFPSSWSGLSIASAWHVKDVLVLMSPRELTRDGHPALRALWIDRYAVLLGIATLAWMAIYILWSLDFQMPFSVTPASEPAGGGFGTTRSF